MFHFFKSLTEGLIFVYICDFIFKSEKKIKCSIFLPLSIFAVDNEPYHECYPAMFGKAGILKIMQSQLSYHSRKKASIVETIFSWSGRVSP